MLDEREQVLRAQTQNFSQLLANNPISKVLYQVHYCNLAMVFFMTLVMSSILPATYQIMRQHHTCDKDESASQFHNRPPLVLLLYSTSQSNGYPLQSFELLILKKIVTYTTEQDGLFLSLWVIVNYKHEMHTKFTLVAS